MILKSRFDLPSRHAAEPKVYFQAGGPSRPRRAENIDAHGKIAIEHDRQTNCCAWTRSSPAERAILGMANISDEDAQYDQIACFLFVCLLCVFITSPVSVHAQTEKQSESQTESMSVVGFVDKIKRQVDGRLNGSIACSKSALLTLVFPSKCYGRKIANDMQHLR